MINNTIVVVLVLYKERIAQTPSYLLLKKILKESNNFYVFVYDNSPEKQLDDFFYNKKVRYVHNGDNPGLAEAYNQGIAYLWQVSGDFLLLLDQDTKLEESYLEEAFHLELASSVGACVPIVISGNRQISPVFSDEYVGINSEKPPIGLTQKRVMAINSGTLLSKETLTKIQNFNLEFPVDFLDHWLFWTLYKKNLSIMVLEKKISHDLSVLSSDYVAPERYQAILVAETNFYKNYDFDQFRRHRRQLFLRTIKQFIFVKNRFIWKSTWREFCLLMRGK